MKTVLAIICMLIPSLSMAQPNNLPVFQSGVVTPGHVPVFDTSGVIMDGGAADNGNVNALGIIGPNLPFCINDAPISSLTGYHQFCLGANNTGAGALLSYQAYGGATPLPLLCNINGVQTDCLSNVTGTPVVTSVTALRAFSTATSSFVIRSDWAPGFGAPSMGFIAGAGTCVGIGTVDNGASCVNSIDGNHWSGSFPPGPEDIREYGAQSEGSGYVVPPVNPAGTYDSTTAINAALATGANILIPAGWFHVTQPLTCTGFGQSINGLGRTQSIIDVGTDYNMSAVDVVDLGGTGQGAQTSCEIHKTGIQFYQSPTTVNRAALIAYPWAISCSSGNCGRAVLDQVRISRGYKCLNLPGNSGGVWIGRLELGCYNINWEEDGDLDYTHVNSIEVWPYGSEGVPALNASGIWGDGNVVGASLGSVQGLAVSKFSLFDASVTITANNTSSEGMIFDAMQFDNLGTLTINGGKVQIGKLDLGISNAQTNSALVVAGTYETTRVSISNLYNTSGPNSTTGTIYVSGGYLDIEGGIAAAGGISGGVDNMMFEVSQATSTSMLKLNGLVIRPKSGANLINPVIKQTGGTLAQLIVTNCTFENGAGSTGTMFDIGFDGANNYISDNSGVNTWGASAVSLGFVPLNGYYDFGPYKFTLSATPSFSTEGDFSPSNIVVNGGYYLRGKTVEVDANVSWTNNAYGTASGFFNLMTNLPPSLSALGVPGAPLSIVAGNGGMTLGASQVPCNGWINGASNIGAGVCTPGSVVAPATTTNFPASTSSALVITGRYPFHF